MADDRSRRGCRLAAGLLAALWLLPTGRCQGDLATAPGAAVAAAACGRCHQHAHDEWRLGAHARAFTDPVFQQALRTRHRPEACLPCHVPDRVLQRLANPPRARDDRRDDGVDCAACHLGPDGAAHGPEGPTGDGMGIAGAHATVADIAFARRQSTSLCASCHDLKIADVLPVAREFRRSHAPDDGDSCVGCHFESVRRPVAVDPDTGKPLGPDRPGRTHRLLGPDDPGFCASAFRLALTADAGAPVLLVGNGAGHGVPGLQRLRWFTVRLSLLDRAGRLLHRQEAEISWRDRLLVDEERRLPLPALPGAVALRVQVDHNFTGRAPTPVVDRTLELP